MPRVGPRFRAPASRRRKAARARGDRDLKSPGPGRGKHANAGRDTGVARVTRESYAESVDDVPMRARAVWDGGADEYRYLLERVWDERRPRLFFVGLNPSTATAEADDNTLRRVQGFARRLGFGGLLMGNAFAWRTRHPKVLKAAHARGVDVIGPENDAWLVRMHAQAGATLLGFGADAALGGRGVQVARLLASSPGPALQCLGLTKEGFPRHPLYLPNRARRRAFRADCLPLPLPPRAAARRRKSDGGKAG